MTFNRLSRLALGLSACVAVAVVATAQDESAPAANDAGEAAKPADSSSYYIGLSIGEQMRSQEFTEKEIDVASLAMGLSDVLAGREPRLSEEELAAAAMAVQKLMQERALQQREKMMAELETASAANKEKAELFLAENAKKEGVKVLPSGLQYKVEKAGTGASPKPTDRVKVHYTGRLLNGEVFDSSVERGEPAVFRISDLIPAWKEALPRMKVGGKWTLYVPPSLGYGQQGSPPVIGPNELLIFEMELLDIVQ